MIRIFRCVSLALLVSILASPSHAQAPGRVVHVFVALADNAHQGIVPVPAQLGNGDDPDRNLYWGAAFGVRTFFRKSADWEQIGVTHHPNRYILERATFRHRASGTLMIADGYRGSEIKQALADFFEAAAGQTVKAKADLAVYIGHDGLMDFSMDKTFQGKGAPNRQVVVLACASKQYFGAGLKPTGAEPLLWTTSLMAPEAYTLKAALDGWIAGETNEQIRQRAAAAYAQYQRISQGTALKLFATGW